MRLRLLSFLVCPISGNFLDLLIWEERKNLLDQSSLEKIKGHHSEPAIENIKLYSNFSESSI